MKLCFLNVALVSFFGLGVARRVIVNEVNHKITPKLQPNSDSTFFGSEYPHDKHPGSDYVKVDHPFPIVQDSDHFDADFVKDENGDDGAWQAQQDFDKARHNVQNHGKATDAAREALATAAKDLAEAKQKVREAQDALHGAHKRRDGARQTAEEAKDRLRSLAGGASGGEIGAAKRKVEKEEKDLEECEKQLKEAEAQLKKLTDGMAGLTEKLKTGDADALAEQTAKYEADHARAKKEYETELAELKGLEERTRKAAAKLRKYRKA